MEHEKYGNAGAVLGIVLGALAWAVLMGFVIKEPVIS